MKPKKAKRNNLVVMYVRVKPEEHARVKQIADKRGYPHSISSVASEIFSRGLAAKPEPEAA